jgi:hypothetical protein
MLRRNGAATALEDTQPDQQKFQTIDPPAPTETAAVAEASAAQSLGTSMSRGVPNGAKARKTPPGMPFSSDNYQPRKWTVKSAAVSRAQDAATQSALDDALPLKDAEYSEEVGETPDQEREAMDFANALPLTNQAMFVILRQVAPRHSRGDLYSAVSADREFATQGHGAFGKRHFGLGFGILLFTQESGQLGSVLQLMHDRDPDRFSTIFGADGDSLLSITNAETREGRLQPVNGENIWTPKWISRFQTAGAYPAFQAAQNEHAIEFVFRPMLRTAGGFGLDTDRLLAMALDLAATRGTGGAIRWLAHHIGPFETPAQRYHAIEILGVDNLASFQAEVGWTPQDGQFGPETHAALAGALRRMDIIPMPKRSEIACRLAASAEGPLKQRLTELRDSSAFTDQVYDLT